MNSEKKGKDKIPFMKKSNFREKKKDVEQFDSSVRPIRCQEITVNPAKIRKYLRGNTVELKDVRVKSAKSLIKNRERKIEEGAKLAARREKFLTEQEGFLEPDEGEASIQFSQSEIQSSVDPISACKRFDLHLREFGPYRINYIKNGRYLAMGGRRGHIAAFNWVSKKLLCEMNVMEEVFDVAWLHQETMFAAAQKKWVYIYDNQGIEIHCLKALNEVIKMEFLPYHFLLSTMSSQGYLSWLDVSVGKMVAHFQVSSRGTASTIAQNPFNAHICIGEPTGLVRFWSPNSRKPAVTKWCHKQPLSAIAFDPRGQIFATASMDRTMKFWDARNLQGPTQEFKLRLPPRDLAFSHRGILALALGNIVQLHKDGEPYLRHKVDGSIMNMQFCPFEDVLGVGHSSGFSSLLVPGSAEPNVDALEVNPFQSKSQRRETEVKSLLEKIPAELITWNPSELQTVHIPSLEAVLEARKELLHVKQPDIKYTPKKKTGKASKNTFKRKTIVKEGMRKRYFEEIKEKQEKELEHDKGMEQKPVRPTRVLDRFKPKQKKSK